MGFKRIMLVTAAVVSIATPAHAVKIKNGAPSGALFSASVTIAALSSGPVYTSPDASSGTVAVITTVCGNCPLSASGYGPIPRSGTGPSCVQITAGILLPAASTITADNTGSGAPCDLTVSGVLTKP